MTAPLNLADWEGAAEEAMEPAAFGYVTGGAGDEVSVRRNRTAFDEIRIVPRALRGPAERSLQVRALGSLLRAPILTAPMAYQGSINPEGDLHIARAAAELGVGMCLSSLSTNELGEVASAAQGAVAWYQLYPYRDEGMNTEVIARAREAGFTALIITVDAPTYGIRERDLRSGFSIPAHLRLPSVPSPAGEAITPAQVNELMRLDLGWDDLERFVATSGLPVVIKGLLHPDDARRAVAAGARGVVVSNHGGRQLDTAIPTIEALADIVDAAPTLEVFLDSGVRRGTDVLKALALGARAVLVGRPVAWANAVAGADGVRQVLAQLIAETENALTLAGCASPREVTRDLIRRPCAGH
jgi:4-hydroxymandelate oxidase